MRFDTFLYVLMCFESLCCVLVLCLFFNVLYVLYMFVVSCLCFVFLLFFVYMVDVSLVLFLYIVVLFFLMFLVFPCLGSFPGGSPEVGAPKTSLHVQCGFWHTDTTRSATLISMICFLCVR